MDIIDAGLQSELAEASYADFRCPRQPEPGADRQRAKSVIKGGNGPPPLAGKALS